MILDVLFDFVIGQNSWIKLEVHMTLVVHGFNCSWLSCKKKHKTIFMVYRDEKKMHEILGQGRLLECKWFHQMDIWYRLKSSVKNQIPTSSTKG
jgi:hypothetical protein